ncbi:efflux RND transporter permease subunit, partial [bacterium]|nr:efflux RND transporter permease subunit [bacterium]
LPVFTMTAAEGKLFTPLAYTKTFALIASIIVALTIIPPFAHLLFTGKASRKSYRKWIFGGMIFAGAIVCFLISFWAGFILIGFGLYQLTEKFIPASYSKWTLWVVNGFAVFIVTTLLSKHWLPLGADHWLLTNWIFVVCLLGSILLLIQLFQHFYAPILRWCLQNKLLFLSIPTALVLWGGLIWLGFDTIFGFLPQFIKNAPVVSSIRQEFPGLGKEFMPSLDEGSYLYMPTTMPHASIGESMDVLQKLDMAINAIPEVDNVVGKIGRVDSSLDPAPISMVETIVNYKSEYITDESGHRLRFQYDHSKDQFVRDEKGELIPDPSGKPFRQWRDEIQSPDDIWDEITKAAQLPGTTSAPKLQPIAARIVMLQSGMRAPMGIKVKGPDLETIEIVGLQIEKLLKQVPSVKSDAVIADRIVGKPYLEIDIDRKAIARYGISIRNVQDVIEVAIGGKRITTTVEGRERYPVRVRYMRELRDTIESLGAILVPSPTGVQIPMRELADIR